MLQLLCSNKMEKKKHSHTDTLKRQIMLNIALFCRIIRRLLAIFMRNIIYGWHSQVQRKQEIQSHFRWVGKSDWGQTTAMLQHTMASVSVVHWAYEGKKCRKNPTQRWKWKFCCKFRPKESLSANIADSSGFRYSNTAKLLQRWVQVGTTISFCLSVFCLFSLASRLCRTQRNLNTKQCRKLLENDGNSFAKQTTVRPSSVVVVKPAVVIRFCAF